MADPCRVDAYEAAARGVGGNRVIREDETAEALHGTMQRPVAFHRLDSVGDHEVNRDRGGQLDDGILYALPVQHVFGPAVDRSRHDAEQVLQTQRDAGPVMRFDLGH
jgi:hypothetical protein